MVRIERVIARLVERVQRDPGEAVVRGFEPFGATVRIVAGDDRRRRRWSERLVHHVPVQVEVVSDPGVRVPGDAPEGGLVDPHVLEAHRLLAGNSRVSIAFVEPAAHRRRPGPESRSPAPATGSGRPQGSQSLCSVRSTLLGDPELLLGREHRGRGEARDRRVRRIPERHRGRRADAQRDPDGGAHAERRHDEHHELPALRREGGSSGTG